MEPGRIVHPDGFWFEHGGPATEHALRPVRFSGVKDLLVLAHDAWAAAGFGCLVDVAAFAYDAGSVVTISLDGWFRRM
jgi:hypothetical protein